jgi:hypothetical protein
MNHGGPGNLGDRLLGAAVMFLAAAVGIRIGVELIYSVMWQLVGLLAIAGVVYLLALRGRRDRW